jgi:ketosteroid isomerase-like protein
MLREWVDGYVRAWNSNDPADIGALFTDDAVYFTEPYEAPWRGRDEIVAKWLEHRDEPGQTTFHWQPLVETPELSILTGTTVYRDPPRSYSNLWVIRFDSEGRCREFTEWWMKHPDGG